MKDNFTTAGRIRAGLNFGGHVSVWTVISRLNAQHLRARRPIKRSELKARHRIARLNWSRDHLQWNIRNWRRIHWSDESRFVFGSGGTETPRIAMKTSWAQQPLVGVVSLYGGAFLSIVSCPCTFFKVISMALVTVITCLTRMWCHISTTTDWPTDPSSWTIMPDHTGLG